MMIFSKFGRAIKFNQVVNIYRRGYGSINRGGGSGVMEFIEPEPQVVEPEERPLPKYLQDLEKIREKRKEIVIKQIKKAPHLKESIVKAYNNIVIEETNASINKEMVRKEKNIIYDTIVLTQPHNPDVYLKSLFDRIYINEFTIFDSAEKELQEKIRPQAFDAEYIKSLKEDKQNKINFERGRENFLMGDMDKAIQLFEKCGDHGMSNIFLGTIYYQEGAYNDYQKSHHHFTIAAKSKIPVAFGMLGELHMKGLLNKSSVECARCYFTLAANLNLKSSTEQAIYMYINKIGGDVNLTAAIYYCKKLSFLNGTINSDAVTTLGGLYLDSDLDLAKDLWIFASRMGNANAMHQLARHYYTREYPDYNNSFLLWKEAARQGNPDAQFNLGVMYDMGFTVDRDPNIALQLFESSAKQGNSNAQFVLGESFLKGANGHQDEKLGWYWIEESAKNGDQIAVDYINSHFNKIIEKENEQDDIINEIDDTAGVDNTLKDK